MTLSHRYSNRATDTLEALLPPPEDDTVYTDEEYNIIVEIDRIRHLAMQSTSHKMAPV